MSHPTPTPFPARRRRALVALALLAVVAGATVPAASGSAAPSSPAAPAVQGAPATVGPATDTPSAFAPASSGPAAAGTAAGTASVTASLAAASAPVRAATTVASNVTITGRGFGHGHGMSQWGAYGASVSGVPWTQIVDHYYPGTVRTAIGNPTIRVDVRGDLGQMSFVGASGLTVTYGSAHTPAYAVPTVGADGSPVVSVTAWLVNSTSTQLRYTTRNGSTTPWGPVSPQINVTSSTGTVSARSTIAGRIGTVRGELRAVVTGGTLVPVVAVPMDEYLRGVVPHESPASWPAAALAAQAVAARSYAAYSLAHPRSSAYDICDTTSCQVYLARDFSASTDIAIAATAGIAMRYQGQPAFTEFSASTGGWNAAGSQPYLVAQADPWDNTPANPNSSWNVAVSAATLQAAYPSIGTFRGITVLGRDGAGMWGGRVTSLAVQGSAGSVTISGGTLQARLGLRSTYFTVLPTAANLVVATPAGASGRVEVTTTSGSSGYAATGPLTPTDVNATDPTRMRLVLGRSSDGARPDVLVVQTSGTASGHVEVVTSTSSSGYATGERYVTPMGTFTPDSQYEVTSGRTPGDVCFVMLNGTGSGKVEVHCLSASSTYSQWSLHAATGLAGGLSASSNRFLVAPGTGDLSRVIHAGTTGSGRSELHRLSASSGYRTYTMHAALPPGYTSDSSVIWSLRPTTDTAAPDLAFVLLAGTGSGHLEVHVIGTSTNYTGYVLHAATSLPMASFPTRQAAFG